jgi:hypothetical protein
MERPHPFGGFVGELPGRCDQFVKLQMQVPEIGPNNVPMGLFSLELEFNQIRQNQLEIICQSLRCLHVFSS